MSNISKRRREGSRSKLKSMGDHQEFLKRISKTLYYGRLPSLPCLSLPVTEVSCSVWSLAHRGRSLRRLHADEAARIARGACVSPCALVLALLYMERLQLCNPDYLAATQPAELFLVSLMIGNKFLQDDGEDDEVISSEWAASGGLDLAQLKRLELEFLSAIDWKVFVSEEAFENGLVWLERQVALRQAAARGFFTYGDLAAGGDRDTAALRALLAALSASAAALALGYLTALAALLTSSLALTPLATLTTLTTTPLGHFNNATVPSTGTLGTVLLEPAVVSDSLKCCSEWQRYQDSLEDFAPQKKWYDGMILNDWKSYEPWWSTTSVLNWLYQSSLINPMQRWLEETDDPLSQETGPARCRGGVGGAGGGGSGERRCIRQWLNLSKLSALMVSVSDR